MNGDCFVTVQQHVGFNIKGPQGQGVTFMQPTQPIKVATKPVVGGQSVAREVGFKGLLSISQASHIQEVLPVGSSFGGQLEVVGTTHVENGVRRLVKSVVRGLKAMQEPERACTGLGGTYFFVNELGRKVGIMKPCDEEPLAPNNPKDFVGRALGEPGLKPTVRVGEAAIREVAAYLLDHDHFAKVPSTVLVKMSHPIFNHTEPNPSAKLGSLQEFVSHHCDTSEMGSSRFGTSDVHRIGILDIRLYNTDRHAGNLLVKHSKGSSANLSALARLEENQLQLIPIDHGFCLPEALEPPYFEWLHWPQAMLPFDAEELAYIAELDPQSDADLLRRELPMLREECLHCLEVCTVVLQKAAAAGLSLFEIGSVLSRPLVGMEEEPSELEKICTLARDEVERLKAGGYDESESDSEDSECESGADEGLDPFNQPHTIGTTTPLASHLQEAISRTSTPRHEDLLFTLEDEPTSNGFTTKHAMPGINTTPTSAWPNGVDLLPKSRSALLMHAILGSDTSPDSQSSGSLQDFMGSSIVPGRLPYRLSDVPGGSRLGMPFYDSPSPELVRHVEPMAHSMGRMHTFLKGKRNGNRRRRRRAVRQAYQQVYPPPIEGAAPTQVNAVFSNITDEEWRTFMEAFSREVDEALCEERWVQDTRDTKAMRGAANMGTSAPT